jgi:hypothetical protein
MRQELVPLYRVQRSDPAIVVPHATGTLMQFGTSHFLATAAHAIHHPDMASIMIPGPSGSLFLSRRAVVTHAQGQSPGNDPIDFGIIALTQEEAVNVSTDYAFLDVMAWPPMDHPERTAYCHIAGYPCEVNQPHSIHTLSAPQLFRIDASTDKRLLTHSRVKRHKVHPKEYIALRYDPRRARPDPRSRTHRLKYLPGLSGGAIYAGHMPVDDCLTGTAVASRYYIGMFLEVDPKKRPTGEICCYGLSLLTIQRILTCWDHDHYLDPLP